MPTYKYKCKECGEELSSLNFQHPTIEYGTYNISSENHETDGSEGSGDCMYICPECGEESEDPENIFEEIEDDEESEGNENHRQTRTMNENNSTQPTNGNLVMLDSAVVMCALCRQPSSANHCPACVNALELA